MEYASIEREIHVDASPEVVFEVVSSPEHISEWWSDAADFETTPGAVGELDGTSFLAALVAWVLNGYERAFDHLEEELEELDEQAMRGRGVPVLGEELHQDATG